MGLASRSGTLDEEIKSVDFRAEGFDTALAAAAAGSVPGGALARRIADRVDPERALADRPVLSAPRCGAANEALGMLLARPGRRRHRLSTRRRNACSSGIAHQTVLALDNARLVDELRAASTLKSEFIGTMSHELRSPLNAILGYTELLRRRGRRATNDPDAAAMRDDTLGRVRFYALQLLEMIQATLDVSRLEAGRLPLHAVADRPRARS